MSATPERKPRRRPQPTWAVHSAEGVRITCGDAPDWWDTCAPGYVAREPTTAPTAAPTEPAA
jgi:hypothetical protein